MRKYVISYDALTKEAIEKEEGKKPDCKNLDEDFKIKLIKILCTIPSIDSIDWVNMTTITFTTNNDVIILNAVASKIDALGFCVDYHLAVIQRYTDKRSAEKSIIRQKKSVTAFKELVTNNCARFKK